MSKYYKKIQTNNLPKKGNRISWIDSVGYEIEFTYKNVSGLLKIKNYIKEQNKQKYFIIIEYLGKEYPITTDALLNVKLGNIIGLENIFKHEIGEHIINGNSSLTIIEKKCETRLRSDNKNINHKYYKIKCKYCDKEFWKEEKYLESARCTCDSFSKVVIGKNDIPTTASWMVDYFQGGYEEAKRYTSKSNKMIYPKCPHCGTVSKKLVSISNLYKCHGFRCECSDKISYPEKILLNLLKQLNINYDYQKTAKELFGESRFVYDFYLNDFDCIIETNGSQHYREKCGFFTDPSYTKKSDKDKMELALNKNIKHYIVIDCSKSNLKWIKEHVLESDLFKIINKTSNIIDWNKCEKYALSNIVKEVCDFKTKHPDMYPIEISKYFPFCRETITNYLHIGNAYGWCEYTGKLTKAIKISLNGEELGIYESAKELSECSINDFGVKFTKSSLQYTCTHNNKYKGYTFEYV